MVLRSILMLLLAIPLKLNAQSQVVLGGEYQDRIVQHELLADGTLLAAGLFDGNHSDVVCRGRSFAAVSQIEPDGHVRRQVVFDSLAASHVAVFSLPSGYPVLFVIRGEPHCEKSSFEIWRLDARWQLHERIVEIPDTRTMQVKRTKNGSFRVVLHAGSENRRSPDKSSVEVIFFSAEMKKVGQKSLGEMHRVHDLVALDNAAFVLLEQDGQHLVTRISSDGRNTSQPLDFAATHLAVSENQGVIFAAQSIGRYENVELNVQAFSSDWKPLWSHTLTGDFQLGAIDYLADHNGLWLAGSTDRFGAVMQVDERGFGKKHLFTSLRRTAFVNSISELAGKVVASGYTSGSMGWGAGPTDGFVLLFSDVAEDLAPYQRCVVDVDLMRTMEADLLQRLRVDAFWPGYARDDTNHPYLIADVELNQKLPASDTCGLMPQADYMSFLSLMRDVSGEADYSDFHGFEIFARLGSSANVSGLRFLKPLNGAEVHIALHHREAELLFEYLTESVYPHVADSLRLTRLLQRETGIVIASETESEESFRQRTAARQSVWLQWQAHTKADQDILDGLDGYHQLIITADADPQVAVSEYATRFRIPAHQIDNAIALLVSYAGLIHEISELEGRFWRLTRLMVTSSAEVTHSEYVNALRGWLAHEGLLKELRHKFGGLLRNAVVVSAAGKATSDGQKVNLRLPAQSASQVMESVRNMTTPFVESHQLTHEPLVDEMMGMAIRYGWNTVFSEAIQQGADLSASCSRGAVPLQYAVKMHRNAMVVELLKRGADINGQDINGRTALHAALAERNIPAIRLLLDRGADPNLPDVAGRSALDVAREHSASLPGWVDNALLKKKAMPGKAIKNPVWRQIIRGCSEDSGLPVMQSD
ncbi:MAG: ankyrin repeat domain-containing protein [bacterium]